MPQPTLVTLAALDQATNERDDIGDESAGRAAASFRELMEALGLEMRG